MPGTGTGAHEAVHWCKVVISAGIPLLIGALNERALNVALPSLQSELGIAFSNVGWTLLAFLIADAAVLIAAGRYGDRFGRRRTAIAGLIPVMRRSVLCVATPNFALLIARRVIEGLGVGFLFSEFLASTADAVPPNSHGRACGLGLSSVRWRSWPVVAAVMATIVLLLNGESVWFLDLRVGPAAGFLERTSAISAG